MNQAEKMRNENNSGVAFLEYGINSQFIAKKLFILDYVF